MQYTIIIDSGYIVPVSEISEPEVTDADDIMLCSLVTSSGKVLKFQTLITVALVDYII